MPNRSRVPFAEIASGSNCYYATHPLFPTARCNAILEHARTFFALSERVKQSCAIEHSCNFRGYSQMQNERDWREQIHFGREEDTPEGLRGANLWTGDPAWRDRTLEILSDLEQAGRDILNALTNSIGIPPQMDHAEDPYILLKMILYHPPGSAGARSGVAPHVDFSWITLLIQDDTGGLEIQTHDGWRAVPYRPGTLVVNAGEILEFASRGHFLATPHRVMNRSHQPRLSLPFFLNPSLTRQVEPACIHPAPGREPDMEHVHKVFPVRPEAPFLFGKEEWRRKGLGIWCQQCVGG